MMEKASSQQQIAPQDQGGRSRVVQRTEGMDVSRDALLPPIIKIVQPTTKDGAKYGYGKFLRTDTEEVFDTLEIIPLVSKVTQTKWPEEFSRDAQPTCWSSNGIAADPGAEFEGRECHTCPFFSPKPQKGKGKGMCETGHNLILQDADTYTPYGMRLRGTGNRIMGLISSPSIAQKAVVRLSTEEFSDARGTWYQLKAKTLRQLDEADKDLALATMRSYLETNLGYAVSESEDPSETAGNETPAGDGQAVHPPVTNGFEVTVRAYPEMHYTASGKAVVEVMGQTPQGYKKLVVWEELAERFSHEVGQGDVLVVNGRYNVRRWSDKNGEDREEPQLVLSNFQRLGFRASTSAPATPPSQPERDNENQMEGLPF